MRRGGPRRNGQCAIRHVVVFAAWLIAHCALQVFAVDDLAPRLFFSDAKISFTFPNHWTLESKFPYGPLFTKATYDGKTAIISCVISAPVNTNQMSSDISQEVLKQLAKQGLAAHEDRYKPVSEKDLTLSGHNAFQIIWENVVDSATVKHQTVYFFVENRVYALSLQTSPASFRWLLPDFDNWVSTVRILSRKDAATLTDPSHGGLWIHQTGGVKIPVPEAWLIGVADDRQLGAALAQGDKHTELTVTVDVSSAAGTEFSRRDRKEAVKSVHRKGLRILSDKEEVFHGYPAYIVQYEGAVNDRVVKGMDIWVLSPKARWLFNLEGDVSLYNSLSDQYQDILKNIEFI